MFIKSYPKLAKHNIPNLLTMLNCFPFAKAFQNSSKGFNVNNNNLVFDSQNYTIKLFLNHPDVQKKSANTFELSSYANVATLIFLDKNKNDGEAWKERTSLSLKFKQLNSFLEVEVGSDKEVTFEFGRNNRRGVFNILQVKDMPSESAVKISCRTNIEDKKQNKSHLSKFDLVTSLSYRQYRMMYKLIELNRAGGMEFCDGCQQNTTTECEMKKGI